MGTVVGSGGAGHETPLLAFYLSTSAMCMPAVMQELLVTLRELLLVLEPMVSCKVRDDFSDDWTYLQAEVLDRDCILAQPRGRTLVLQQRGLPSGVHQGGQLSSRVHDTIDDDGSVHSGAGGLPVTPRAPSRLPTVPPDTRLSSLRAVEELRLGSERVAAAAAGLLGLGADCDRPRVRATSFSFGRSLSSKRMSALISGVQDRVQQAQRNSVTYATMFNRPDDLRSISILEKIGSGGFGTVYLGMYQSTEVAVKVILERDSETEVLRNAVELAVMSTLSHPHIVQVLTFFTDVTVQYPPAQALLCGAAPVTLLAATEDSGSDADFASAGRGDDAGGADKPAPHGPNLNAAYAEAAAGGVASTCFIEVTLAPTDRGDGGGVVQAAPALAAAVGAQQQALRPVPAKRPPTRKALVIVMEFCDAGCLADAVRENKLRERVKGGYGALQPMWGHVYLTLLEVALALRYLHATNLVHRDLKSQNVLLRSAPSDPRGFTAKLSDFGLAKLMTDADHMLQQRQQPGAAAMAPGAPPPPLLPPAVAVERGRRRRYSGTVTHVAPEAFQAMQGGACHSCLVDTSVDIYAFGILMWEIISGEHVYLGLNSDQIVDKVVKEQLRPTFQPDVPSDYTMLATRCWDPDPHRRPTAEELVTQLSSMSSAIRLTTGAMLAARRRASALMPGRDAHVALRREAHVNANAAAAAAAQAHAAGLMGLGASSFARGVAADDFPLHIL